ncbi:MAG: flagellar hook-length control protein FliK [Gammaproteobacteria bacterium]|nr:flagellar hook-length control protein FliK [Gammaproteobacteria bacterium]
MFQFPLLGSTLQGLGRAGDAGPALSEAGLNALFQAFDGEIVDLGGELQSMLSQWSPAMLQRFEALLAGGTALPQAARTVLSEFAADADGERFGAVLQRLAGAVDGAPRPAASILPEGAPPPRIALPVAAAPGVPEALTTLVETLPSGVIATPLHPQPAGTSNLAPTLSPQLAGNLLDMGVPQPVGHRTWPDAVAERVTWMLHGDQQSARLKLNPPHLGPLEVRVSVSQDQTQVAFLAQHAAVRDVLEAALPRLREMFDQASLQLVRADVSDPGAQRGEHSAGGDARRSDAADDWPGDAAGEPLSGGSDDATPIAHRLVDLFA